MKIRFINSVVSCRESNGYKNYSITSDDDIFCKNVYIKKGISVELDKPHDFDVNLYSKWNGDKKEWKTYFQILN